MMSGEIPNPPPDNPPPAPPTVADERLRALLGELHARFLDPDLARIDQVIMEAQHVMVERLDLDRSSLWQKHGSHDEIILTHFWQKPGSRRLPIGANARKRAPWVYSRVASGHSIHFASLNELPPEAHVDARSFARYGALSNVTLPLVSHGEVFGAVTFATLEKEHRWTQDELEEIRLVGGVFAQILGQIRARRHLAELREELARRARLAHLGELAATIVHEISQPLAAIRFEAGALRLQEKTRDSEGLGSIEENARRAADIVSRLRELIHDEPRPPEKTSLARLVRESLDLVPQPLKSAGIDVRVNLPENLPPVRVTVVEILQVLTNLLQNAAEALAGSPEKTITISAEAGGRRVRVRVRDSGPGIAPELREKVFQPLFSTRPGGTGLGLAICRRMIAGHGGNLKVSGARGRGASFEFTLPAANESD